MIAGAIPIAARAIAIGVLHERLHVAGPNLIQHFIASFANAALFFLEHLFRIPSHVRHLTSSFTWGSPPHRVPRAAAARGARTPARSLAGTPTPRSAPSQAHVKVTVKPAGTK